ncbi:MAG: hypothetical protein KC613_22210, partial [Myxococcales bacterium]|nr:hypothetical protein [Myxococcales bacterium]
TQVQALGLPVTLLDSLVTQLDAFTALVREAQAGLRAFSEVEATYGALTRRSLVALALAHGLYTQARTLGAPPWDAEWDLARQAYGAAMRRSLAAVRDLRTGANPLGIEDTDLPLYRVGDQVGPGDRFSALSDYLLGQPADARPIVPRLIERTREALTDVRGAYLAARERDVREARLALEQDRRLMDINRLYGEQIIGLCLDPDWIAFDILEQWDQIDANDCYLADDVQPPCRPTAEETAATLTSAEVAERICVAHRLRERVGEAASLGDPAADAMVDAVGLKIMAEDGFDKLQITAIEWGDAGLDDVTVDFTATLDGATSAHRIHLPVLRTLNLNLADDTPASLLPEVYRACAHRRSVVERVRPTDGDAVCDLPDGCPVGMACYRGECTAGIVAAAGVRPECYRGALGEVALAVELARFDVRIARAELDDMVAAFDVAMQGCEIIAEAYDSIAALGAAHRAAMGAMADAKLAANLALIALEAAKEASGIFSGNSLNIGAAIGALTAIPKAAIAVLDREMGRAQTEFEAAKAAIQAQAEVAACVNDASVHMVGAQTAALKIKQASLEFTRQLVEFNNLKVTLDGLLLEGHLSLEAERARTLSPLNTDFWIGEHFDRYERTLRLAKRGLYLSLLAAEYEFQASLPYRADILRATHPVQLEQVLDDLRNRVVTGTVNGASPTDLVQVVSLREHLLQVADRSALGAGWHQLTPAERFGRWLAAPQFAVYDASGQYRGQEIPFNIMPATASAAGPVDVPLLTGTDCAERLWSVNASVLGDGAAVGESTLSRLVVRKRNTFHSQRCGGEPGELQTASTRPSRNLFLDPLAYDASPEAPGALGEDTGYTAARIQARLGISRAELEDERYAQGASEELAGRGLYGDFTLYIPAESLAGEGRDGLVLTGIEDILLRLDYVSVAGGL